MGQEVRKGIRWEKGFLGKAHSLDGGDSHRLSSTSLVLPPTEYGHLPELPLCLALVLPTTSSMTVTIK